MFLKYLQFFMFLIFFLQQGPWDLQGLIISGCIVSRVNGMVINFFCDSFFGKFRMKFKIFWKVFKYQVYGSLRACENISGFEQGYRIVS